MKFDYARYVEIFPLCLCYQNFATRVDWSGCLKRKKKDNESKKLVSIDEYTTKQPFFTLLASNKNVVKKPASITLQKSPILHTTIQLNVSLFYAHCCALHVEVETASYTHYSAFDTPYQPANKTIWRMIFIRFVLHERQTSQSNAIANGISSNSKGIR